MNSIILCEGSSDFVLLQYYMRTVYGWTDARTQNIRLDSIKRSRTLKKDENLLTIGGCGGCSKIIPAFEKILQRNSISAVGEAFDTAMYAYTLAKQMAAIQRRCKKIESRLSLNQPLVVDGTGTLLDIYVYQSYQLENIEIKEFRDGLTLMEHMVLKYLLQERDIENSIGYGYRMRKIIEHAKISLRQKAVEYYGWSYIRSMFA